MTMFKKPHKSKVILLIISAVFLFRGVLYAGDTLRVPIDKDTNKRMKGKVLIGAILKEHKRDLEHLKKVREEGFEALSDGAKEVIYHPERAEWGVNFSPKVYYELRAFILTLEPDKSLGLIFLREHPELFNQSLPDKRDKMQYLIIEIIQSAIFKELEKIGLSKEEWDILKRYTVLASEPWEKQEKDSEYVDELYESGQFQRDKEIVYKYAVILYRMQVETLGWSSERGLIFSHIPGAGDEAELIIGAEPGGLPLVSDYQDDYNRLDAGLAGTIVGGARRHILGGKILKAIEYLKEALLGLTSDKTHKKDIGELYKTASIEDLHPEALSLAREELIWMMKNNLPGAEEIINELGMDRISVEEFRMIPQGIGEFVRKVTGNIIDSSSYTAVDQLLEHLLGGSGTKGSILRIRGPSEMAIFGLEEKTATNKDFLKWLKQSKDSLEEYIALIELFSSEEGLLAYAVKLSGEPKDKKNRIDLAARINTNEGFRRNCANVTKDYLEYLKLQRKRLNEIIAYFEERNKVISSQNSTEALQFPHRSTKTSN